MAPRRRASTLKCSNDEIEELQAQLRRLTQDVDHGGLVDGLEGRVEAAHYIRQFLLNSAPKGHPKDAFRHVGGFKAILDIIRTNLNAYHARSPSTNESSLSIELYQTCFAILSAAFQDHEGNRRFFRERVNGNGWLFLKDVLQPWIKSHTDAVDAGTRRLENRIYACFLACALDDESVVDIFDILATDRRSSRPHEATPTSLKHPAGATPPTNLEARSASSRSETIQKAIGSLPQVSNADALKIMFMLWKDCRKKGLNHATFDSIPKILNDLTAVSVGNLVAIHRTGVLSAVLSCLLNSPDPKASYHKDLLMLAKTFLDVGVSNLDDAHFLYSNATTSPVIAQLLSHSLASSHLPSCFHFDLSLHGFSSIELPALSQAFPPMSGSNGYTLSLWFQVTKFDPSSHTTLFGAFDASQSCFVLVYLEKDTHNLILQTSMKSSRPSVRFKSTSFGAGRWYHIDLTHRRPKTVSSARASLFVDGEFVEQVKSQYPAVPPKAQPESLAAGASDSRGIVQAFFGTPQDLASLLGKNVVLTQWQLASAQLFQDVLSDDLLAVYYRLGPRYTGNFQDCLGSFQTYEASAQLNVRNEGLHPGREDRSEIVLAIKSKAGDILPENRLLLNVSANKVYGDVEDSSSSEIQLLHSLSKIAQRNFFNVARGRRSALALNGAFPALSQALTYASGHAVLTGDPTVIARHHLDDASLQVSGSTAVGLALIDSAEDDESLVRHLKGLFGSIRNNWRNSEAMERENGFGVLANLLTGKLGKLGSPHASKGQSSAADRTAESFPLSLQVLGLILEFVGYCPERFENSIINNPLAYRTLVVDLEIWRTSSIEVQKLFYGQFNAFATLSKYQQFNMKRLSRMRIVKKWLEALKDQSFSPLAFTYYRKAFELLLISNFSADLMRSLSLYITYAIYKPDNHTSELARRKSTRFGTSTPSRRKTVSSSTSGAKDTPGPGPQSEPMMDSFEVAVCLLEMYTSCLCQTSNGNLLERFARTVTNKWLLYLLAETDVRIIVASTKIIGRLLLTSGSEYKRKFVEKSGGVTIMKHRIQRYWGVPGLWLTCFAILFGKDVADIDYTSNFDLFMLLHTFAIDDKTTISNPEIIPVIMGMLKTALPAITEHRPSTPTPSRESPNDCSKPQHASSHSRQRSLTLNTKVPMNAIKGPTVDKEKNAVRVVTRFLADVHSKSQVFRDFSVSSSYVQELFIVLFPVVVSSHAVSAETELTARNSALTFNGEDVTIRSNDLRSTIGGAPVVRTRTPDSNQPLGHSKPPAPKRLSSYILVNTDSTDSELATPKLQPAVSPRGPRRLLDSSNSAIQEVLELALAVFCDQIFARKDFPGLGLFMRVPPGFQEHQAYFETYILRNALSHIANTFKLDQRLLREPRVLTNLARLATHLGEAIYEGWFIDGANDTFDFLAGILEYLQLPDVSAVKAVRLCSQIIVNVRTILSRIVLLRLSELNEKDSTSGLVAFLDKLGYWQSVLIPAQDASNDFLRLFCYLLYTRMESGDSAVKMAAANLWRLLLVHKPEEMSSILWESGNKEAVSLINGFKKIMELDNETFLAWFDENRSQLDQLLFLSLSRNWGRFVADENTRTEETAKARVMKRRERLRQWVSEESKNEEILRRHEISSQHWRSNIYSAEFLKRQRALQDEADAGAFNTSSRKKMRQELRRPCGVFEDSSPRKWQLDPTEGRNRMRMRFIPSRQSDEIQAAPKRRQSQGPARVKSPLSSTSAPPMPGRATSVTPLNKSHTDMVMAPTSDTADTASSDIEREDDFEMVSDPKVEMEDYEDKNRRVVRSLQRGDQVEYVHNASRIVGLEAVEGLLIIGKGHLYILDHLFQRGDGEIVNVVQAPREERDPYLQMISGREAADRIKPVATTEFETRNWRWDDVLSISKRRFLFRDVAIEIFFVDGRSYLLTMQKPVDRNELYQRMLSKASGSATRAASSMEDNWRSDFLRNPDDEAQTLSTRFTSVFAQQTSNPGTRKWLRGELSNFQYLMLVNTMAGRTFNDLTQYPVFPWVIADYTSEELDLSDPRSYRDLTKPMGCQSLERQMEFKDRYQSFAEMGDEKSPPFHYGTHYSSAMIVTSYLIRLEPYVQSYLLLQGGFFDHADRLFYSIEKAWNSASRDNMTDVRELIPEFFYLPEFLTNKNGYDLGERQGSGEKIDNVALPLWAKGDPKIFIAKHREALESDYVTQRLSSWIDLVFGHKQRGEAALEATNVFHHLSYHGAKDLDTIDDPVERLATIGIIHNFGQTPHQVFPRAHPTCEPPKSKPKRLDRSAENLTRLPFPVAGELMPSPGYAGRLANMMTESHDRIAHLQWSTKAEKLLASSALRLDIGPSYDRFMTWGYFDDSVRFHAVDNKKLMGLFEHLHIGQISTAVFADSKTLITAGYDCTISVWSVLSTPKAVDLQPKKTLFGHRRAITCLAVSRSFSALLSASCDGQVILWDFNRLELVRVLGKGKPVECARINDVTGNIMLCRSSEISIWTLNGELMVQQDIFVEGDDTITACAFYEGNGNEVLERQLIFTGHKRGVVNVWNIAIRDDGYQLEHVKRMHHMDQAGFNIGASITAILPMAQVVYTGDDDGRVYEWDCIQRQ